MSFGTLWLIKKTIGIRVEPDVERAGLDVSEHGMWGYPEFYIPVPAATAPKATAISGLRTRGTALRPMWSRRPRSSPRARRIDGRAYLRPAPEALLVSPGRAGAPRCA